MALVQRRNAKESCEDGSNSIDIFKLLYYESNFYKMAAMWPWCFFELN